MSFLPAISKQALKKISSQMRSWRLHHRASLTEADLAQWINPIVRGWMNYYGAFYRSACIPSWNASTPTFCGGSVGSTNDCGAAERPRQHGTKQSGNDRAPSPTGPGSRTPPQSGDRSDKSCITGDRYVRFGEGPGGGAAVSSSIDQVGYCPDCLVGRLGSSKSECWEHTERPRQPSETVVPEELACDTGGVLLGVLPLRQGRVWSAAPYWAAAPEVAAAQICRRCSAGGR
ncbi:group II intron maturase-specific domain-containing protein [Solwaraspora sp. WMMB335]|uniref:group II intron maturase-specific domain-containing protein n=1 Tax=Solwaraspora sp. WMMB335 TaxID=3404118 RepID=UPI003B92A029